PRASSPQRGPAHRRASPDPSHSARPMLCSMNLQTKEALEELLDVHQQLLQLSARSGMTPQEELKALAVRVAQVGAAIEASVGPLEATDSPREPGWPTSTAIAPPSLGPARPAPGTSTTTVATRSRCHPRP